MRCNSLKFLGSKYIETFWFCYAATLLFINRFGCDSSCPRDLQRFSPCSLISLSCIFFKLLKNSRLKTCRKKFKIQNVLVMVQWFRVFFFILQNVWDIAIWNSSVADISKKLMFLILSHSYIYTDLNVTEDMHMINKSLDRVRWLCYRPSSFKVTAT